MKSGASKVKITPKQVDSVPLLGWGDVRHRATRIETEIYSRAVAFENSNGNRLIFVCLEICFISESIRRGVMRRLSEMAHEHGFQEHEIVITATHTHNAPGGYCHSILYNVPSQGYRSEVFDAYVSGAVDSILLAWLRRIPCEVLSGSLKISAEEPVAFNRSIESWNSNHDTQRFSFQDRNLATHRTMDQLTVKTSSGRTIAIINWFAVHCTSVHRDFMAIHSDNKGVASRMVEDRLSVAGEEVVAIFAQGAAGDVSPNFRKYWFKREVRGAFRDDLKSCEFNGEIQARHALELLAVSTPLRDDALDSRITHHDLTSVSIPPEWVGGQTGLTTGPAALGCPFMAGTDEGRGASPLVVGLIEWSLRFIYALKRRKLQKPVHGNKIICVDLTEGKVFGDSKPEDLPIPSLMDPIIRVMRFWSRIRLFRGEPMTPTVMPIQIFRIGEVGFAAVPGEFTTQAGMRLRKLLSPILINLGIQKVVISGYSNSYAGYVTTEEEYQIQAYEGACTHFGRYTLLGYQAVFRQMALKWVGEPLSSFEVPEIPPPAPKAPSYLKKMSARFFDQRS